MFLCIIPPHKGEKEYVNISNGTLTHDYQFYKYISNKLEQKIVPGSILQFMCKVGSGGGHTLNVKNFHAEIIVGDCPRD